MTARATLWIMIWASLVMPGSSAGLFEKSDQLFDDLRDSLTFSDPSGAFRLHASGLLDAEFYHFQQPSPALIESETRSLFNPRATLFLDGQLGPHFYLFVQGRLDRGFDPSSHHFDARLDEYALRCTPFSDGRLSLEVGKFATVFGNWVGRHYSWENPFINAPMPYENLTPIWDYAAPGTGDVFLFWAHTHPLQRGESGASQDQDKYLRLPLIWGPSYATGASLSAKVGVVEIAAEIKNAGLASRPEKWDITSTGFQTPAFDGRIGIRPNAAWNIGFSASAAPYLLRHAEGIFPPGRGSNDYREYLLGQDVSYAWRHLEFWAEVFEGRFQVPEVGDADTLAYYLEAKYKFMPQLYGAVRWNEVFYGSVPLADGSRVAWGRDAWRIDAAVGWRITVHTQLKLEYSLLHESRTEQPYNHILATQFTLSF